MKKPRRGPLSDQEANLLGLLIESSDPATTEAGLERLCKHYRTGFRLRDPYPTILKLNGLLQTGNPKIVRWALNAIALVSTPGYSLEPTLDAINRYQKDYDVLGAGVAALVALAKTDDVLSLMKKAGIPFEGAPLLAAAQQSDAFLDRLAKQRVSPFKSGPSELRLATVLVGLNKAPENLFEPKYTNAEIVGVLNGHDDKLVSQYSIWAIVENPSLSIKDLTIPLKDIEGHPDNIRGWVYRLIGSGRSSALKYLELIENGASDNSQIARLGLANGLNDTYFDGLDEITHEWFFRETDSAVRAALLDHMAGANSQCQIYEAIVLDEYRKASFRSLTRSRLEAAARKTGLYRKLRAIELGGETATLFAQLGPNETFTMGGFTIVNQNVIGNNNIIGNMAGRDINVGGDTNIQQKIQEAHAALDQLAKQIAEIEGKEMDAGRKLIADAKNAPSKHSLQKVADWMKSISDAANYAVTAGGAFGTLYTAITHLIPALPHS